MTDIEYRVVSYEDVLKASYENKTNNMQIIISYHTTDNTGNNVIKTDKLQNYTYNENVKMKLAANNWLEILDYFI